MGHCRFRSIRFVVTGPRDQLRRCSAADSPRGGLPKRRELLYQKSMLNDRGIFRLPYHQPTIPFSASIIQFSASIIPFSASTIPFSASIIPFSGALFHFRHPLFHFRRPLFHFRRPLFHFRHPLFHFRGYYSIFTIPFSRVNGIMLFGALRRHRVKPLKTLAAVGVGSVLATRPLFHFAQKWNNRLRQYARRGETKVSRAARNEKSQKRRARVRGKSCQQPRLAYARARGVCTYGTYVPDAYGK